MMPKSSVPELQFGQTRARGVKSYADLAQAPDALDAGGFWAICAEFEGPIHAWQMEERILCDSGHDPSQLHTEDTLGGRGPKWISDQNQAEYESNVIRTQEAITSGEIYQANICRMLKLELAYDDLPSPALLLAAIEQGNPAPYAGYLAIEATPTYPGAWVVSASPELGFNVSQGRVSSKPIKGTAPTPKLLLAKDRTENVMIADVVRNDLARICIPGTVQVTKLLELEYHPGLVHLVTTVEGQLAQPGAINWANILQALHPPASVSGAPKVSAQNLIASLETSPRGPYCGQLGWIDVDKQEAQLAVGIRSFFYRNGHVWFGTGAGITADSDPTTEWNETILKSSRLLPLFSGRVQA